MSLEEQPREQPEDTAAAAEREGAWDGLAADLARRFREAEAAGLVPTGPPPLEQPLALTDMGNAERLVRKHGPDLLHCGPRGGWHVWDGARYRRDETGSAQERVKDTVLDIPTEADLVPSPDPEADAFREAIDKWARTSQSRERLSACLHVARSDPKVAAFSDDLDRDQWALNLRNGTLDLRSAELRPHQRSDRITKLAPVKFDPEASCPLWEACLATWIPDADVRRFLQISVGIALTGDVSTQHLWFPYGTGANGKSVFILTVLGLLGDYGRQTAPDLLTVKRYEAHPTERADLAGARFVATVEVEQGKTMAEEMVKQLTGGDRMKGRFMRQDFFEFDPTFKVWLVANHKPDVKGTDYAIWRRIWLVPFEVTIPEEERDPQLVEKLAAERPGILRWALEGCRAWDEAGRTVEVPEVIREATEAYRVEVDQVEAFIEECCEINRHATVGFKPLFSAYKAWAEEAGERGMPKRMFTETVESKGYEKTVGHARARSFIGLRLLDEDGDGAHGEHP